LARHLDTSER